MTEHLHREELVRLPGHFFCYQPPEVAPEVSPLPARTRGYVTFGSFNNFSKVSEELLRLWAEILGRVPNSRLLLQSKTLGEPRARRKLLDFFAPFGIAEERIRTLGRTSFLEHLALFHEVDVALDTYPWNGHTTTCHTLWMGVPVITMAGRHCAARMGVSVLSGLGLQELIAATPEEYAASAVQLAGDLDRLDGLRQGMRARMAASPLTDAAAFNRTLERAYRQMWRGWCEQNASRAAEQGG
jgi:predicted O-linked N-acetylglucosamine transferase (SPINDLY family)